MRRKRKQPDRPEGRPRLEEMCDQIAVMAQAFKSVLCRRKNGPADMAAALVYRLEGDSALRSTGFPGGHPVDTFNKVWARVLEEGTPDFVAVVAESYMGSARGENYRRGELEQEFKQDPNSSVREAVLIAGVDTREGRQRCTAIPFSYDRNGMPAFRALGWDDEFHGDRLSDLLAECARQVQRRTGS